MRLLTAAVRITVKTVMRAALVASVAFLLFVGIGPHFASYRVLTVLTGSMRGTASPGDLIVDTPVPLDAIKVGDVITYQTPTPDHHVVSHRVIEIVHAGPHPTIRTQGDANNVADPWQATLQDGPAWKVRGVMPKAGFLIHWFRGTRVHTATTRLIPLVLALVWLGVIWRDDGPSRTTPRHRRVATD